MTGKWISVAAALAALAMPARAGAEPAPPKISAEAFGELPFLTGPAISPDGRHFVAGSVVEGKRAVVLGDFARADFGLVRIGIPDVDEILSTRWAGNQRVLLSLLVPVTGIKAELKVIRLFVYDVAERTVKPILDKVAGFNGSDVIFVDPAGAYLLLSAQSSIFEPPSVLKVDLSTLKSAVVVQPHSGVFRWYADGTGQVRAGLGVEDQRWWLFYRESGGADFRKIAKGKDYGARTVADVERLIPVAHSDKGYVVANESTGRYGVYRYDFATNSAGEPVFEHPEVDVEGLAISPKTGEVEAVTYVDDRERTVWLDPKMKAVQAQIDRTLPNKINRIVSRDEADQRMIVWSGGASDPGSYYLFDRARKELREIAHPYASLDGKTLAPVEPVRYPARDGLSIPAYLTLPVGRPGKALPLIIMPHGGPFHRDKWEYDVWAQFLANRGYAVLQPNFRGSTGYGKTFVDAASGEFGRKMQDDLDDGVRWLVQKGVADPKRVCIMGGSYGGYAALWGALRNPDIYRCAISFAGISDVGAMVRYDHRLLIAERYYRDWRDRIRGASSFNLDNISPLYRAAELRVPLFLAHGADDHQVPPEQSKKMHAALLKAGKPHEFVLYPKEGHGFSKAEDSIDFLKRVDAFLEKYNPAG